MLLLLLPQHSRHVESWRALQQFINSLHALSNGYECISLFACFGDWMHVNCVRYRNSIDEIQCERKQRKYFGDPFSLAASPAQQTNNIVHIIYHRMLPGTFSGTVRCGGTSDCGRKETWTTKIFIIITMYTGCSSIFTHRISYLFIHDDVESVCVCVWCVYLPIRNAEWYPSKRRREPNDDE